MLSIEVTPTSSTIGETGTAVFMAKASGINKKNFIYRWIKIDSDTLPGKASSVDGTLTIPNLVESDEGQYYCIVTNEWGTSVRSNGVILTVEGT